MSELSTFTRTTKTYGERTGDVYVAGSGPGVLVMHEVPGLHPDVIRFGQRLVDEGFTVWMPDLFGTPQRRTSTSYELQSLAHACVSKEFTVWRTGQNSPIVDDLRELSKQLSEATGGSIGAVGMCLTGGFALGLMVDPWVAAPVLSQPSLPFGVFPWQRRDLNVDEPTLAAVKERVACGTCVLGLRYAGDPMVPTARFDRLRSELGDGFEAVELPGRAHSVLARDWHEPTVQRVVGFFREHAG